jgi:hypothetical protein
MTDTVLFTDQATFAITSVITLVFAFLLVSKGIEQHIGRLEFRIRQAMWLTSIAERRAARI